jgi:hypothetical protein
MRRWSIIFKIDCNASSREHCGGILSRDLKATGIKLQFGLRSLGTDDIAAESLC